MSRSVKGGAAVVCRSCQTLGRRNSRCRSCANSNIGAVRSAHQAVPRAHAVIGVGRPSAGGRRTVSSRPLSLQHRLGLPVLWRSADRSCSSEGATLAHVQRQPRHETELEYQRTHSCRSLPLRCAAAPNRRIDAIHRSIRPVSAGVLRHANAMQASVAHAISVRLVVLPNPSVERTSNGGARLLAPSRSVAPLAAAHVKR